MLSDLAILEAYRLGDIVISPFHPTYLGPNSYDCRIGEWYFDGEKNDSLRALHLGELDSVREYWGGPIKATHGEIWIKPQHTILAHTEEIIGGQNGYVAKMYSRSTVARSGLSVCRCAGVGDVGYIDRWTMEITNHTDRIVIVPVKYRICQFVFDYVGETQKNYQGSYSTKKGLKWAPMDMLPKGGK
jgi:dCTP deaminase